jgi:hypothetical protein
MERLHLSLEGLPTPPFAEIELNAIQLDTIRFEERCDNFLLHSKFAKPLRKKIEKKGENLALPAQLFLIYGIICKQVLGVAAIIAERLREDDCPAECQCES